MRIFYLDFVKGIAILSVILGHINTPLSGFIYSWHMPVFFILSGVLMALHDEKNMSEISIWSKKDFYYLGKFYLLGGFMGIVIGGLKNEFIKNESFDWLNAFIGWLFYGDYSHMSTHYGFVLWFLPVLFWGKMFTRICVKYFSDLYYIAIFILGIMTFGAIYIDFPTILSIRGGDSRRTILTYRI